MYWRILALEERFHAKATVDRWRGRPRRENVIQDVELPIDRLAEFVSTFQREVPISPFWLCPLRQRDTDGDVGALPSRPGEPSMSTSGSGRVSLSQPGWTPPTTTVGWRTRSTGSAAASRCTRPCYYPEDRFWDLYNGPAYRDLKQRYDPAGRLLDLYAKCVGQ